MKLSGKMKKVVVDNGDDNAKDVTEVSSADLIGKKLTLNNFGEEDKLKLGNQTLDTKPFRSQFPTTSMSISRRTQPND